MGEIHRTDKTECRIDKLPEERYNALSLDGIDSHNAVEGIFHHYNMVLILKAVLTFKCISFFRFNLIMKSPDNTEKTEMIL